MSEICASCLDFDVSKVVKSKHSMTPKWLSETNYVQQFIERNQHFSNYYPASFNVKTTVQVGKQHEGKKILYWATKEKKDNNPIINDARTAYGNFSNSGIARVNKNGDVVLKFQCPQVYRTTAMGKNEPRTYYRHLHFVISNKDNDKWGSQIYTKIVVCKFGYQKAMKLLNSRKYLFINALPAEYYGKDHIPHSYNLTHNQVKKMTQSDVFDWLEHVVKLHYPHIHEQIRTGALRIYEIPIITYCAHEKCNASDLLLQELMKKGVVNVNEYSGGMKEYRKYMN